MRSRPLFLAAFSVILALSSIFSCAPPFAVGSDDPTALAGIRLGGPISQYPECGSGVSVLCKDKVTSEREEVYIFRNLPRVGGIKREAMAFALLGEIGLIMVRSRVEDAANRPSCVRCSCTPRKSSGRLGQGPIESTQHGNSQATWHDPHGAIASVASPSLEPDSVLMMLTSHAYFIFHPQPQ